jgi:hypothetical protein
MNEHSLRRSAHDRLQPRYRADHDADGDLLPALDLLYRVAAVAEQPDQYADLGPGEADQVDLLAALALVGEVRDSIDHLELRLIGLARGRKVTWNQLADALSLRTRQSAESRALRLETSKRTSGRTRDVAELRALRARDRALDSWAVEQADRLRRTAEGLVDSSEAWPAAGDLLFGNAVQRLAALLVTASEPTMLWDALIRVRHHVAPHDRHAPKPAGPKAAAAEAARRDLAELFLAASKAVAS